MPRLPCPWPHNDSPLQLTYTSVGSSPRGNGGDTSPGSSIPGRTTSSSPPAKLDPPHLIQWSTAPPPPSGLPFRRHTTTLSEACELDSFPSSPSFPQLAASSLATSWTTSSSSHLWSRGHLPLHYPRTTNHNRQAEAVRQLSNGTNCDDLCVNISTVGNTIQTVNSPIRMCSL